MKPKGFTLVELLLGAAIAAIIGATIYNMFWSAVKLDDKMRGVYEHYMEALMADQLLTHDLENAVALGPKTFDGQRTEFSFLTQTPKGIKRVRYYSDAGSLMRQESDTSTQIVATGPEKEGLNCRYGFKKEEIVYKDSWDGTGLPLAVSCAFGPVLKRDIFLAPVPGYYNEQ